MYKVEIWNNEQKQIVESNGSDLLLPVLRDAGHDLYAPCGGNGTCGKCKVWIVGEGSVTSCFYPISSDISVRLPDQREAKILVDQHNFTQKLPLWPGDCAQLSNYPYGVAIDIGTTTLVFYLVDLITGVISETRAVPNPQAKYGSDVISRINYTSQQIDGLNELREVLINIINEELKHFIDFVGIGSDDIVKLKIAGNTTMLHILLGKDPLPLALAPFIPQFTEAQIVNTNDLGLKCNPKAHIETLPNISAYVGADIVAGLASIAPDKRYKNYLFMDIGTNGELALVTDGKIICCATAAGPAFEGANIKHGVTATDGAISEYNENEIKVIGNVPPVGICGSGLIDIVAHLVDQGIVDAEGLFNENYIVVKREYAGINEDIVITQEDIREVQLAKSAISAGVNILLKKVGLSHDDIDAVFLAGGFGNYIDTDSAMKIGLLSTHFKDKIISLGNTSGTGAFLALKSEIFNESINEVMNKAEHIELSEDMDFAMEFAINMMFDTSAYQHD
ncbi:MAG: ASKHA domain-containing protein [Cytophagales bacterium]|nr:ASKHA domain-containing protein [Cytophagales bacterium]